MKTRRAVLRSGLASASALGLSARASRATDALDPRIQALAARHTADARSERDRAVRLHDVVRDHIAFGWTRGFYDLSAAEVLDARRGYCVTKTTLFVALCRAAGLDARPVFVDIKAAVIRDFVDPGTPYVDHSFAEVRLGGRWIACDSYIVSRRHLHAARDRLRRAGRSLGWGVHIDGTTDWTGTESAFVQFVNNGRIADLSSRPARRDRDIAAYLESGAGWNETPMLVRMVFGLLTQEANRRVDALVSGYTL